MVKRCVHVTIYGRVQGVCFRESTRRQANTLGVSGWVKNCFDGSVEAIIEGEPSAVEKMLEWLRQGPAFAKVDKLQYTEVAPDNSAHAFRVRY